MAEARYSIRAAAPFLRHQLDSGRCFAHRLQERPPSCRAVPRRLSAARRTGRQPRSAGASRRRLLAPLSPAQPSPAAAVTGPGPLPPAWRGQVPQVGAGRRGGHLGRRAGAGGGAAGLRRRRGCPPPPSVRRAGSCGGRERGPAGCSRLGRSGDAPRIRRGGGR